MAGSDVNYEADRLGPPQTGWNVSYPALTRSAVAAPSDADTSDRVSTGLGQLDALLGGGLPAESLVTIAGVPGAGKSIMVLHGLAHALRQGHHALYVTTTHHPHDKLRRQYSSLSFLEAEGLIDNLDFFELGPQLRSGELVEFLNAVVRRLQECETKVLAIDSFRVISDMARSRGEIWRLLGELCRQLVLVGCVGILVGEYTLPRDLDLPEFAMADVVIGLDVERKLTSDLRTLRLYKLRGGAYDQGQLAFDIGRDGIRFLG